MSAEPGRKTAVDLRWRVVWQKIGMELSYRRIAQNLNVAVGTVYNTFKLFERTGSVEAKEPRKRPELCKLDYHHQLYVVTLVLEQPNLYLSELCSAIKEITNIQVSPSTVCRLLARYGLTRKKIQYVAAQRSLEYRAYILHCHCFSLFKRNVSVG